MKYRTTISMGAVVLAWLLAALPARAADRLFELGCGGGFTVLGSYDVGGGLGMSGERDDLGPGMLGTFLVAGIMATPRLALQLEGGLAVGGVAGTDDNYYGEHTNHGSTMTAWGRIHAGWDVLQAGRLRLRIGAGAGAEHMSEVTDLGAVRLSSVMAGPTIGLGLGDGLWLQLHGEVNVPLRGEIEDRTDGDPTGVFGSGGVRVLYLWGLGHRS